LKIELTDHVGVSPDGNSVDHNQWVVMCDGTHVGYLQKNPNAWLACIVYMDEEIKAELIEAVSKATQLKIGGAAIPVDPDLLNDEQGEEEYE
jgi:hypothetical protein